MATAAPELPAKPDKDIPLGRVDQRTGQIKIDPIWDRWFKAFETVLRTVRSEIP